MIIDVKDLTFAYARAHPLFDKFNFQIEKGSYWGILGRNGAGKSTLMELLIKFRTPQSGQVDYHPQYIKDRSQIVLVSHSVELNVKFSVQDFFNFHSKFYTNYSKEEEKRLIGAFKIRPDLKLTQLSTGQQKQVQAICCLASRPQVLLLDEITAVLDPDARSTFFELIHEVNSKHGVTVVLATNIKEDLSGKVSDILYLKDEETQIYRRNELAKVL